LDSVLNTGKGLLSRAEKAVSGVGGKSNSSSDWSSPPPTIMVGVTILDE
jgi:hypothetical protein